VIPKFHGAKLADIPDDQLSEILVGRINGELGAVADFYSPL
jgi:hypothetical protein